MARRIELTAATWHALDDLSQKTGRRPNDLAEEAFADLLKKHRHPRSLKEALREVNRRNEDTGLRNKRRSLKEALQRVNRRYGVRDEVTRLRNRG